MFKNLLPLFVGVLFMASCSKNDTPTPTNTATATTSLNVAYGTHPQQVMDVYLPAGRSTSTTKVLIMIHGGAWAGGDKADFTPYVDTFKRRMPSWALININYRLAVAPSTFAFPTQENDVKAAMDFIYSKRNEYGITDKWALLGASAGAHLSMLQAYKYSSPVKPKAVINFFGPSDMADMYNHPASAFVDTASLRLLMGGTPVTNPTMYTQSSPINFVNAQSSPTITFQGGLDPLVPVSQQTALQTKLIAAGVVNQYKFFPYESHGFSTTALSTSFDLAQAFITTNVP